MFQLLHIRLSQPFLYPDSMIEFLAVLHIKGFDYRSLEGIMRALAKRIAPFPVISYSQICRRVNSLKIDFGTVEQNLIVAGDDERAAVRGMLRRNKKSIKKVVLDGLHDCRDTFNLCERYNIETAIKIRKGASMRARDSPRRRREVRRYKMLGHKRWIKDCDYGLRWPAAEAYSRPIKECLVIFSNHATQQLSTNL